MSELFIEKESSTNKVINLNVAVSEKLNTNDLEIAKIQQKRQEDLTKVDEDLLKTLKFDIPNDYISKKNTVIDASGNFLKFGHTDIPSTKHDVTPPSPIEIELGTTFVEKCASYESDVMAQCVKEYSDITHNFQVDNYSREIHRFDDGQTAPLVVVVFKNARRRLVSVNQHVLPMRDFINIQKMVFVKNEKKEEANHQLRGGYAIGIGHVKANTDETSYTFPDTTVPLLMMAVAHFADKYYD